MPSHVRSASSSWPTGARFFLDEIGELPLELQPKLLRVLQDGELQRVGSLQSVRVDTRGIAATNRDLDRALRDGRFRSDLYYRLSVFPIEVPPLRERKEDIPDLVQHFVARVAGRLAKPIEGISPAAIEALCSHSWPGNVRELESVVERAAILCQGKQLVLSEWTPGARGAMGVATFATLAEVERGYIQDVLEHTGWVVSGERGAAQLLGLKPTTLDARMRKLGIVRPL